MNGEDPFDVEVLYRHGWESDPDCLSWWKSGEPEDVFTLDQAIRVYEDWAWLDD
jgi:hypothetical protein